MFFGGGNNKNNNVNVNTTFYNSYSDSSLLTIGGWNKLISLKLYPATGKDANGVTQYAQEQNQIVSTSITQENALALLDGIENVIKPAIKEKKEGSVSISMGSNENKKVLTIKYDGKDSYLEMVVGVNENGIADSNNVISHKFNKKSYLVGYNYQTGTGSEVETEADFLNFVEKIKDSQEIIPTTAHAINYSNAVRNSLKNNNNNGYNNSQPSYSAPVSNFNGDITDILPFN